MTKKLWFQVGIAILLTLVIIRMIVEVQAIFNPFFVILRTIFLPLLIGGVLFYLARPLVKLIEKKGMPRWGSITTVILILLALIAGFTSVVGPALTKQINDAVDNGPAIVKEVEAMTEYVLEQRDRLPEAMQKSIQDAVGRANEFAVSGGTLLINFFQGLFQGIFMLVLVPFFLIYMLKDHEKFAPFVAKFFRGERKTWIRKTLADIDETLKTYIQGQLLVSFLVGVMLLIGYWIIDLDYALLLALFGMLTNVIPFLGPYLAVIPAMIIAFIQDPIMAVWVAIIMLVAQQIESNLITPNVMGKSLDIHPLTVITIILSAGSLAGLWGIILAIPAYAVVKSILQNIYAHREEIRDTANKDV
ncbi:AI-2E family transporter [Tetzosporium hominis]|uniref:AI-2E family transporter n=1 Tax=Tetzosporium hominis TaxID=2020506 RepID=A0A264VZV7_9BACL|nr:AI-2E family transporter [Tetzosporium hominis]OZS76851.1 AI-2E family transporter [Tetzosporium hominis]